MANKKQKKAAVGTAAQPQPDFINLRTPMQYIMRGFVLAMFTFFPLNISDNYTLVQVKERTLSLLLIFALASIAFVLFYQVTQGRKFRVNFAAFFKSIRPYEYAILAYFVVMSLSTLLSPHPEYVMYGADSRGDGYRVQCLYILTFLIIARFYKPCMQDLLVLCIGCAVICGYGIFQYYGLDFLHLSASGEYGPDLALVTTMSNKNMASTYFVLAFCVGYVCFTQKTQRWHWAFLPLTLITFYMIVLGDTESGYVGVLAAGALSLAFVVKDRHCATRLSALLACCFALLYVHALVYPLLEAGWAADYFPPSNVESFKSLLPFAAAFFALLAAGFRFLKAPRIKLSAKAWRIGWPAAFVVICVLLVFLMPTIAKVSGIYSLQELANILQGNVDDHFMSGRAFVWRRAITLVPEHPLLGTGPDTFFRTFQPFYDESTEVLGVWFDKAHNEYLQLLLDVGILGLAAMLVFYFMVFWQARKQYVSDTIALACGVAMLCFVVQAFFNFSTPVAHPIVWTMWGVFAAAGRSGLHEKALPPA